MENSRMHFAEIWDRSAATRKIWGAFISKLPVCLQTASKLTFQTILGGSSSVFS